MSALRLVPLGDQAVLAYCRDETAALRLAARVRRVRPEWLIDVVGAYTSVAVYYDLDRIDFAAAAEVVRSLETETEATPTEAMGKLHVLPCCYELQLDLGRIAEHTHRTPEEIIRLHAATEYTVYAIGFCPGFPYMGYLPHELCGVPRLTSPRLRVEVGSVGLTGRQTGIYTEPRPGGWNLVGRTPLELVNVADGYFPLRTGDRVRFRSIDEAEYRRLLGERL
ncbi:MAG TPA: carboxyltransferase domain-containing protein [Gemmataceae bacterium]|nr:carboxyltransferase domain-containing protein [Gemmataceae bacterium]